jgi:hypothetical protein
VQLQCGKLLEDDGQVLAVISGHDHQGSYAHLKGIHYIVLHGNMGVHDECVWAATSKTEGFDAQQDNLFALVEISKAAEKKYHITLHGTLHGYGRLPADTVLTKQT